jgi:hypothetical protein
MIEDEIPGNTGNIRYADETLCSFADGQQVEYQSCPSPEDREALWSIVQAGFIDLNRKSYEKQDMTREEFEADMDSPDVLKYVAYDSDHNPLGCLTAHMGLDTVTWADKPLLEKAQQETDKPAPPYYVGTVVVPPDQRGTGVAKHILQGALNHFKTELPDALCFFDCADANYPWLAQFIAKCGEPSEADGFDGIDMKVTEIGKKYWVKGGDDGEAVSVEALPPGTPESDVLDVQHYYSILFG